MSINLQLPKLTDLKPRLTVIGVGGAGCNGINNMIAAGLQGVEFVAANTDAQSLTASSAEHRIQLGANLTEGLGAGAKPEIGEAAAEEAYDEIKSQVAGSHMVFVAAGMGGGTGTGAASVVARAAKELDILTVGVVTRPFLFEGSRRMRLADAGIEALRKHVDTLIVIPNQNLFRIATEKTTFAEAFVLADQVLYSGVACIVDLIIKEGLINLDFADVRAVMSGMGSAMMGTGEGSGERRAILAAEAAIANPLLDDVSLTGASGVLLSITGGADMTLYEVDEAASRVRQEVDPDANIIVGATFDDTLEESIRVSIVASGMHTAENATGGATNSPPGEMGTAIPGLPPIMEAGDAADANASVSHASDLEKRLTDAMQPAEAAVAASAGQVWHGPGNVLIEEGGPSNVPRPTAGVAPADQSGAGYQTDGQPRQSANGFQPQAPTEMPRSAVKMPDIEEFPSVGQRAYRAGPQSNTAAPGQTPPAAHPQGRADSTQKPGLFQRIAGIRRRGNESPARESGADASAKGVVHERDARQGAATTGADSNHVDGDNLPKFFKQQSR